MRPLTHRQTGHAHSIPCMRAIEIGVLVNPIVPRTPTPLDLGIETLVDHHSFSARNKVLAACNFCPRRHFESHRAQPMLAPSL